MIELGELTALGAIRRSLAALRIIMRHTKDNPVKGEALAELVGVNYRTIPAFVAEYTRQGFAVCSGAHGYWLAKDRAEWEEHLEKEHHRAVEQLEKISEARKNYVEDITLLERELPPPNPDRPLMDIGWPDIT